MFNKLTLSLLVVFLLDGCATVDSQPQNVQVEVKELKYDQFLILPIEGPDKRLIAEHLGVRGTLPNGSYISSGQGLYKYTFDARDVENIKLSILKSIEKSGTFENVGVTSKLVSGGSQLFLKIHLHEAGVLGDALYTTVLNGKAALFDSKGNKLLQVKFDSKGAGPVTVSQSKNKAIKRVVEKIIDMLNKI
jgi:hypothetical protein